MGRVTVAWCGLRESCVKLQAAGLRPWRIGVCATQLPCVWALQVVGELEHNGALVAADQSHVYYRNFIALLRAGPSGVTKRCVNHCFRVAAR
jgi:hypothetical protein